MMGEAVIGGVAVSGGVVGFAVMFIIYLLFFRQ